MPKRSSKSDDPIESAKNVLDQIIAKHDPESTVAFEVELRRGQIVPETLKQNPKASLRVSGSLLKDVPDGKICAVKLRNVEGHSKESYAIINVSCAIDDGDLVVCGTGRPDELMRVRWQPKGKLWHLCPARGTDRHPWPQPDLYAVWGKVVKIIDDPE
jgi:hypothetical protein